MLIELNKQQAPSIDLESFNYFFNKANNQYVNKAYNVGVDTDQQRTDDLRVLKSTALLRPSKTPKDFSLLAEKLLTGDEKELGGADVSHSLYGATYEFNLPADYLHLLNCVCIYKVNKRVNCPYNVGDIVKKGATKCTADTWPLIMSNLYLRPTYKRPYYYINNINQQTENPTNPVYEDETGTSIGFSGTDSNKTSETGPSFTDDTKNSLGDTNTVYEDGSSPLNRSFKIHIGDTVSNDSTVTRTADHRYGNSSNVRLEIRYGQDSSVFELIGVSIDYLKVPKYIRLTQEQVDLTEDVSQTLEYPDYVCQEIINELVKLIMENASDPRLQTHPVISQSIASPAQATAATKK